MEVTEGKQPTAIPPIPTPSEDLVDQVAAEVLGYFKLGDLELDSIGLAYQSGYLDGVRASCRNLFARGYQQGYLKSSANSKPGTAR